MSATALRINGGSIAEVLYPKDSIVVCRACGKPLYRLERSIWVGEGFADSAKKYAPVSVAEVLALAERTDLEPGQRARIRAVPVEDWRLHCERIERPLPGRYPDCPSCKEQFVFGWIPDSQDGGSMFGDKGFKVSLATIPPPGQARRVTR